jgi:GNAT superfamily N-acetyltransferase
MPHTTVRRVLAHEYPKYRAHLLALDTDNRYLRFGYPIQDAAIHELCAGFEANWTDHILFAIENHDLEFVAVGHVSLVGDMELAFSVLKQHQHQGMGNALMKRVISWCRTHGELKGCMVCLTTNAAIQHLCIKHGIHVHREQGEILADIELDSPNITTYLSEAADSNMAIMDYVGKRMRLQ